MKKFLLFCLFIGCSLRVSAQAPTNKNSLRLAIDYTTIGVTDQQATGRYSLIYTRHLANDRLDLEGSLGYASQYVPATAIHKEAHLHRTTADFSLLYTLLGSSRHKLRLGAGPSLWYRQEAADPLVTMSVPPAGDEIKFSFTDTYHDGLKAGLHITSEYSYALSPSFTIGGRATVFYMDKTIAPAVGVTTGFNF